MNKEEFPQKSYPENHQYQDDDIQLIDYLRVIWKWKWLIMGGTLICAIVAAVISLQMPRIYEISMIIEPGIAGVKDGGGLSYIDSAENISGNITESPYNRKIQEALHLDPLKTDIEFKSAIVGKTNLIHVTSQWEEGRTDLGIKVTQQLMRLLSDNYGRIVEQRKGDYNRQITTKRNEISKIETRRKDIDKQIDLKLNSIKKTQNEIKLWRATLKNISQRKGELLEEMKGVKDNTEKIVLQRDMLLKDKNPDKDISLLLYVTTIQQSVAYFNELSNQIYNLGTREKEVEAEVNKLSKNIDDIKTGIERLELSKKEELQTSIGDINAQINALNLEKGLISNIRLIQEPEVSLHPVKPKKKKIVFIAGMTAFFMLVFLAFFIEYIKNASRD